MPEEDSLPKEKVCNNRTLFNDQQIIAYQLSEISKTTLTQFLIQMKPFKARNPSVFPAPETIFQKTFYFQKHNNKSSYNNSQSPKETRCNSDNFEVPLLRLYSVDNTPERVLLNKKLVQASESRFAFAKDSSTSTSPSYRSKFMDNQTSIEDLLYNVAKNELLADLDNNSSLELDEESLKTIKRDEDENLKFNDKWISPLFSLSNSRGKPRSYSTSSSVSSSTHIKIKAPFDGKIELGTGLYSYVRANIG